MSNPKANIRLTLTPEQKEMVKNQTGKSAEAVEFSVQELEERIAPTTAVPLDCSRNPPASPAPFHRPALGSRAGRPSCPHHPSILSNRRPES